MKKVLFTFISLFCLIFNASIGHANEATTSSELSEPLAPFRGPRGGSPFKKPVKGGHSTNVRESNRGKHEKADSRRQKEQAKAEEKREQNKKREAA